jgi:ribosome-interacting GTPase 1
LIIMMLDAQKGEEHKAKLTRELDTAGIRLNKEKPNIIIKLQKTGGIHFSSAFTLTKIDDKMVKNILQEYRIHNAHVKFNGDYDVDDFIDVIEGNRKYTKCIYVYNKIDTISIEDVDLLTRDEQNACISC